MPRDDIPAVAITNNCIVLDLDQTLIATQDNMSDLYQLKIATDPKLIDLRKRTYHIVIDDLENPGVGTKTEMWGVTRPHLQEFLIFCFSYFKIVAVWTAGKKQYAEAIVDAIFRDIRPPHIIFTYNDILMGTSQYVQKPLINMINAHPRVKQLMTLKNTIALDDNPTTFSVNPSNGILIPEYNPACSVSALSRDDPTLLQLKGWLLLPQVVTTSDLSALDKSNIFGTSLEKYRALNNVSYGFVR